jgi:peptidoglycan hydrolase-like protein with peptidoglycan-binding domain
MTMALLCLPIAMGALSSCSTTEGSASAASAPPTSGVPPSAPVSASVAPVTDANTTAAPTTTEAVTTTVAPSTTVAPTEPPTTTVPPTLPPNVAVPPEPVPAAGPFAAVGGSGGASTAAIQGRLLELGFWLSGTDGGYGLTTSQAVMAFQKYSGLRPSGRVDRATADALGAATVRAHATVDSGNIIEVDKARQLLFIVHDGRTVWTLNTSTGSGKPYEEKDQNTPDAPPIKGVANTPDGLWKVYRERPDGWWEGDLGKIYRPKYFAGGAAIHGLGNVPNYPASHGCVRVSIPAMDMIWDSGLIPKGTPVWVHGKPPG